MKKFRNALPLATSCDSMLIDNTMRVLYQQPLILNIYKFVVKMIPTGPTYFEIVKKTKYWIVY